MSKSMDRASKRCNNTRLKRKTWRTVICVLAAGAALGYALTCFAGTSLLTPGTSRTIAGSSFDFTLNVGSLRDSGSEEAEVEGVNNEFVIALSVNPEVSDLSVKEGAGSINAVSGEYQVTSSQLGEISVLHFSVTPSESITSETTYTVSVNVSGSVSASDSFNLIVVPKETPAEPEDPGNDEPGNDDPGQQTPDKPGPGNSDDSGKKPSGDSQQGKLPSGKMPSGKMPTGEVSAGSRAGTSSVTASNLVYAGSWDNYLDELSVDDYEFTQKFNKTRDTYVLNVPLETTSLTVNATASDSSASVAVTGNTDLPEGQSKIMVSVTADDGSVRVYRIYVNREDPEEEEDEAAADGFGGSGGWPEEMPENMPEGMPDFENMEPPEGFELPEGMQKPGSRSDSDSSSGSEE